MGFLREQSRQHVLLMYKTCASRNALLPRMPIRPGHAQVAGAWVRELRAMPVTSTHRSQVGFGVNMPREACCKGRFKQHESFGERQRRGGEFRAIIQNPQSPH